jgi:hypothetical protein
VSKPKNFQFKVSRLLGLLLLLQCSLSRLLAESQTKVFEFMRRRLCHFLGTNAFVSKLIHQARNTQIRNTRDNRALEFSLTTI